MDLNPEFGEVREPSSRAFWDDFDQLGIQDFPIPELNWQWEKTTNLNEIKIKTLVLLEGPSMYIQGLIKTIFNGMTPACRLSNYKTKIFEMPINGIFIGLSEHEDPKLSGLAAMKFMPFIQSAENVIVANIQHSSLYKGSMQDPSKYLHFVKDLHVNDKNLIKLSAPNIIYGLSAGVASLCKHLGLPFSCYMIYLDSLHMDAVSVKPILDLLNKIGVGNNLNAQFKWTNANESNLYT